MVPLVGIALLFWLLIIRPASKRQKELGRMQSSLKTGDEVMLTSGIFGVLRDTDGDPDHVRVEIADGVTIKVVRGAIGSIAPAAQPNDQAGLASDEPEEN
nr:preprotein translocase subunit YajC [Nocardioides luti]